MPTSTWIMSSPVKLTNIFSVRIAAVALQVTAMALLLSTPFVDVLVIGGGPRWFAASASSFRSLTAAAVAIAITVALFRPGSGPAGLRSSRKSFPRSSAPASSAALQIARSCPLRHAVAAYRVDLGCRVGLRAGWRELALVWPARAAFGDGEVSLLLLAFGMVLLGGATAIFSPRFADTVVSISANSTAVNRTPRRTAFAADRGNRRCAEGVLLLRRDPWLVSQSLMQLFHLVPPALLLVRGFSDCSPATMLVTPVIVMAAGQLAGGLAWLTISGEWTRPTWWPPRR